MQLVELSSSDRSLPSALELGATLYCPANHPRLLAIIRGQNLAEARSVVICTEDSLAPSEVPHALQCLDRALGMVGSGPIRPRLFFRPRNLEILDRVLEATGLRAFQGVVIPKCTIESLRSFWRLLEPHPHLGLLPTLETQDAFDGGSRQELRRALEAPGLRDRVIVLRIGGNDLLALLRLRRPRGRTIYETPLGALISQLVMSFVPAGFSLSGPVCELIDAPEVLAREVQLDLEHGLTGKTAIHPQQIPVIERTMKVGRGDLEEAQRLLAEDAPGVFAAGGRMCEPATHRAWAVQVQARASVFGITEAHAEPGAFSAKLLRLDESRPPVAKAGSGPD